MEVWKLLFKVSCLVLLVLVFASCVIQVSCRWRHKAGVGVCCPVTLFLNVGMSASLLSLVLKYVTDTPRSMAS